MDTKSKSNDNGPRPGGATGSSILKRSEKPNLFLGIGLILCMVFLAALSYICAGNLIYFNEPRPERMVWQYYDIEEELVRYAKNLNRYYIYYGGETFAEQQTITAEDIEKYRNNKLSQLMEEEIAIEEKYREKIMESYHWPDELYEMEEGYYGNLHVIDDYRTYERTEVSTSVQESYSRREGNYETSMATAEIETVEPGNFLFTDPYTGESYLIEDFESLERDTSLIIEEIYREREEELQEIRKKYVVSSREMQDQIISEKKQNYTDIVNYLETQDNFQYFLYDQLSGRYYTNIPIDQIRFDARDPLSSAEDYGQGYCYYYVGLKESSIFHNNLFNGVPLSASFEENGLDGYIYIPHASDYAQRMEEHAAGAYRLYDQYLFAFSVGIFLLIAIGVFAFVLHRKSLQAGNGFLNYLYGYQPFLIKCALFIALILFLFSNLFTTPFIFGNPYSYYRDPIYMAINLIFYTAATLYMVYSVQFFYHLIRNFKSITEEMEFQFVKQLKRDLRLMFYSGMPVLILLYVLMVTVACLGTLIVLALFIERQLYPFVLLCYFVFMIACFLGYKLIVCYGELNFGINEIIDRKSYTPAYRKGSLTKPIKALARLDESLEVSIEEAVRSQRLKTELITNVSHDLKTPLTSIINYVDLLKRNGGIGNNTTAMEYVNVLESKSQRLKILIEDLFEASKLNSGSAELHKDKVNLVDLLKQTMGELSEKMEAVDLIFKFSAEKEPVYAWVDGQKMWRVFENLLQNILKYALPGSRVYIHVNATEDAVEIIFRNISAFELSVDPEELFERFKRGDASRTTEGSGLGLSIARSIVELHGGEMNIMIDGDLFKVVITLPHLMG